MSTAAPNPTPWFFVAVTPMGGRKFGVRHAPTERALTDALRRDRLLLLRAWKAPAWSAPSSDRALSMKDQAALNESLATLLARGVPLVEALEVAGTVVSPGAKQRIERMREAVAAGASFAGACEQVGGFDVIAIAVYRAAERTGDLASAAARIAAAARRRVAIGSKAVTLLIYPSFLLAIGVIVLTAMLTLLVPIIGNALVSAGATLPWYSEIVINSGLWLRANILWVGLGVAGAITAAILFRRQAGAIALSLARRIPAVKRLQLSADAARFFAVMGAMTRTGVPVADALGVAAGTVHEPTLRRQLDALRQGLVDGGLFRNLIEDVDSLPVATRRLLIAAERAGDLDAVFDTLANDLADEVDTNADRAMALLGPALILLLFAFIAPLLVAIMVPMLNISRGALS